MYSNNILPPETVLILFIMGVAGGSGVLLLIYGSRKAELSKIMLFDYIEIFLRVLISSALVYYVFLIVTGDR